MREIASPLSGPFTTFGQTPIDIYKVGAYRPELAYSFYNEYYRRGRQPVNFLDAITHTRNGNATMTDSSGNIVWAPHNLLTYSEDFSNEAWTKVGVTATVSSITEDTSTGNHRILNLSGIAVTAVSHTVSIDVKPAGRTRVKLTNNNLVGTTYDLVGSGSVLSGSGDITALDGGWYRISTSATSSTTERLVLYLDDGAGLSYTGDGVSGVEIRHAHLYRSDLGGMADNPDQPASLASYVPTTSSAVYLPRRGHHVYNGSQWVNKGLLHESEARTQLLHTTDALVTQSHTVTAVPHTLHFTGTGTVILLGASTAGPLVGTGTGENNRVSLTFTPTAGTLTLTVSGTVSDAQLEVGPTPSSYIPNLASSGSVTRAAETLTIPAANLPWSSSALSIQMDGLATGDTLTTARWYADSNNYITQEINTTDFTFEQADAGTVDAVTGGSFTAGINTPFSIASRHGSTFINGAVGGTSLTEDTTPTALPDLSATDLQLGYDMMGTISLFRIWANDLGDTGIEEAST